MVSIMSNLGKSVVSIEGALVVFLTALLLGLWTVKDTFGMSATFVTLATVYLTVEAAFVVYGWHRYQDLNRPCPTYPDKNRVLTSMERFKSLNSVFNLDDFLVGWFLSSPPNAESIPRGNIEEFVSYGFFCRRAKDLGPEDAAAVAQFIRDAERLWGIKFSPGYDPKFSYMAHVWEPLRVHHKLLVVYAFTEVIALVARTFMWLMGFRGYREGKFLSWVCKLNSTESLNNLPVSPNASMGVSGDTFGSKQHNTAATVSHSAVEQALDAAVAATSTAAAKVSQQYPHTGQKYPALPPSPRPCSPVQNQNQNLKSRKADGWRGRGRDDIQESQDRNHSSSSPRMMSSAFEAASQMIDAPESTVPVVFLHGVGFGVLPYLHFVRNLMKSCPGSSFIILEVPHVALRLCKEAESVDDVALAAVNAVKKLGAQQACFIGHSYGSFCVSRIVQLYPDAVHSIALLDPVCLLTCYPQLLYNFIYRKLSLDMLYSPGALFDGARFLCSRDLTISQAFCRKFHWTELMLWPEDIRRRENFCVIVLAGGDDLVPAELVAAQFESAQHPARVMLNPDLGHGGLLIDTEWRMACVDAISSLVHRSRGKISKLEFDK